ncbi:hypothetical protein QU487_21000 [Crenobacter sp. SG2305]|uniref:hypothetical protein n=1 Tax=Crenobacter oryzisoli TaxID=3056844 RepID=UPI0025AABF21|nr:hypothetical protein [Crenobacter sp. SG2305]MDN0085190.1 hypothetical protein [Crenobacter sp. SG2305]
MPNKEWVDSYLLRYSIGTILGAAIVFILFKDFDFLKSLLFLPDKDAIFRNTANACVASGTCHAAIAIWADAFSLNLFQLIAITSFGFVYCYFCSMPVLIDHVARLAPRGDRKSLDLARSLRGVCVFISIFFAVVMMVEASANFGWVIFWFVVFLSIGMAIFVFSEKRESSPKWQCSLFGVMIVVLVFGFCSKTLPVNWPDSDSKLLFCFFSATILTLIIRQFFFLSLADNNVEEIASSLLKLSVNRNNNAGFTESYRHLREHGNSIIIIMMELIWAGAIHFFSLVMKDDSPYIVVFFAFLVILWLVPGSAAWQFGTRLESHLKNVK